MKNLSPIVVVLSLVLAGCAAQKAPASKVTQPGPTAEEDAAAMQQAVEQLDKAKSDSVVPRAHNDCQAVCKLTDLICEAADKICSIAERHAGDQAYTGKCTSADGDCKSAKANCETCTDRL